MRPEAIGYLVSLGGYFLAAILAALRGWKAYTDRTEAERERAAAEVELAAALRDHAAALRGDEPKSTKSTPKRLSR